MGWTRSWNGAKGSAYVMCIKMESEVMYIGVQGCLRAGWHSGNAS
jgi:hypothetical protein